MESLLVLCIVVTTVSITNSQKCGSVADDDGIYDPLIEGYNQYRMKAASYIQYHSIQDFYKFNHEIGNMNANENDLLYRIYLSQAAKQHGAVCIDGSSPTIYYRPGIGDGVNKFMLNFQGGGWCADVGNYTYQLVPSMDNCYHRSLMYLGTTNNDAPYMQTGTYSSTNCKINPLTCTWNTVFIRYCDGSSFMSDSTQPMIYNNSKLYFRGFPILNAILQYLTDEYNFGNATDVVVAGGSAGGLTVWQHANYIKRQYVSSTANYMAMPDSGFFLDFAGVGGYVKGWKWKYDHQNLSNDLNICQPECVDYYTNNGGDIMQCVFAQNIAQFVNVKLFALQGRFDSWQLTHEICEENNDTASNGYGYNLTVNLLNNFIDTNKSLHFSYLDSCYHHCGQWNTILIDGYDQSTAQVAIYYNNISHSNLFFQNYSYPCSTCCKQA